MAEGLEAFGKLECDVDSGIVRIHPLVDHMIDVAACFIALCRCRAIHRALETAAARKLTKQDMARLAVLAFLHDIGKANSGFQAKRWKNERDIPAIWPVHVHAGHGSEAFKLFDEPSANDAIAPLVEQLCTWGDAADSLLIASVSHHGRPIKDAPIRMASIWTSSPGKYCPATALAEIARRAPKLYPDAFAPSSEPLPDAPAFGHLFAGLVQLADWLGSDTRFFPFMKPGEDREHEARGMAAKAIAAVGLDVENWRDVLAAQTPSFADVFNVPAPHPIQAAMSDDGLGALVILESETGSGKTEAALWRYVHLFKAGLVDSLYFALPTRVAATQLYARVEETLRRLWLDNAPLAVRALPGCISADGHEASLLADFKVLWTDDPDDQKAHQRWAAESAKRFLAAPVAVGTIDQALLGALQVRHAHLRYATLSRSLLVVDEVHASDAYMTVLLERLLRSHLGNGGHALLLSATLGSSARNRYVALTSATQRRVPSVPPFEEARAAPYPAITDSRKPRLITPTGHSKHVAWTLRDIIDSPEQIAQAAIAAAEQGAKVLIIRNTVPAAVATLTALEQSIPDPRWLFKLNDVPTLHHSRFTRQDRPALDAAIEAQLGKARPAGPLVVVGTQTLEQSLDIDADLLITDLCPMDVLLQRIGRLHRHRKPVEERPEPYRSAQAWVLTPEAHDLTPMLARPQHGLGRFHNGGGIYDDLRILEATKVLIAERPEVCIPADNRYLVESATHPDKLHALQDRLGESWKKLGQQIEGDTSAERAVAHLHALDVEQVFGESVFPTDVRLATRLGAQDRIVRFNLDAGPFGLPLRDLPIRHHLLPHGLSPDAEPTDVATHENRITFQLGHARFCYSRLGLERLRDE
ncbi:CRISPR-associated helicase Cas3' [Aromatoleum buckelii]|uniref:CRISPR-associated helicase Cas3 n=1 Tax=Aromatoleum buckelii TaxID=200254 RepID=A0ABX1MY83_9RHOO|nr:CRISPR-associated helicase Cas3' [Aromatoleum buckelii]MCK0509946.1 CRISPR-associated helicase Cas3' [Aromatoleum buckelii]